MTISRMDRDEYGALDAVNWSTLRYMAKSPAHYRWALMHPRPDTEAMKRGRVTHLAVFEPTRWRKEVAIWDGGTRRGKDWDRFVEENRGLELIRTVDAEQCQAIAEAARARAGKLLSKGEAEVTIQWKHNNGLGGRGRLDFYSEAVGLVDLKVTRDASKIAFGRQLANLGTMGQLAYYADGLCTITGKLPPVTLVAVEVAAPHLAAIYTVSEDQLSVGRQAYQQLLDRVKVCLEENHWPGLEDGPLVMPPWSMSDGADDFDGSDLDWNDK